MNIIRENLYNYFDFLVCIIIEVKLLFKNDIVLDKYDIDLVFMFLLRNNTSITYFITRAFVIDNNADIK
jgi:hypothetical protein